MRINRITTYESRVNANSAPKNNQHQVSFGYGEDYGYDPFTDKFGQGSDPNTAKAVKYLFKAGYALGKELLGFDKKRLEEIELKGLELEQQEEREREEMEAYNARHKDTSYTEETYDFPDYMYEDDSDSND